MIEERIQAAKQYVKTLFADRADGHDVEHIRNRVNEDPKPSTEAAE